MSHYRLKTDIIIFYANATPDRLQTIPTKQRMEVIRLLTRQMFNEAARQVRMKSVPSPYDFPDEYEALTNLAKSFSHSQKFSRTIIRATDRTVE